MHVLLTKFKFFPFSLPGSWIQVRKSDQDNKDLISAIVDSRLNENEQVLWQHYQITSTNLYINSNLEERFSAKEKELESVLNKKPPQMFAFGLVRTKTHADEVCERGNFSRQIMHVPLGDPAKGVNVVKHADVLMTWASKKRCQRPWLIVYRVRSSFFWFCFVCVFLPAYLIWKTRLA